MTDVEQLVELSQYKAIAKAMMYLKHLSEEVAPVADLINRCLEQIDENALDCLSDRIFRHFARFRDIELACVMLLLRTLQIRQHP
jgi:hypothetical protein